MWRQAKFEALQDGRWDLDKQRSANRTSPDLLPEEVTRLESSSTTRRHTRAAHRLNEDQGLQVERTISIRNGAPCGFPLLPLTSAIIRGRSSRTAGRG